MTDAQFVFSAPGTPQQNGVVEKTFATLYDKVGTIWNFVHIQGKIHNTLWAECKKTATDLDTILYGKENMENYHTKMFKKNPDFVTHLQIFGEIGIVLSHKQIGRISKISNKGKEAFFVGYATDHTSDVYHICNPSTKRIKISRDVRWIGKFYNDRHPIEIPN